MACPSDVLAGGATIDRYQYLTLLVACLIITAPVLLLWQHRRVKSEQKVT